MHHLPFGLVLFRSINISKQARTKSMRTISIVLLLEQLCEDISLGSTASTNNLLLIWAGSSSQLFLHYEHSSMVIVISQLSFSSLASYGHL